MAQLARIVATQMVFNFNLLVLDFLDVEGQQANKISCRSVDCHLDMAS